MQETLEQAWIGTCNVLKETLSSDVFDRWISVIKPVEVTDDLLTLSVSNDFYLTWLEENYVSLIATAFTSHTGLKVKVTLAVNDAPREEVVAVSSSLASDLPANGVLQQDVQIAEQAPVDGLVMPSLSISSREDSVSAREERSLPLIATPKSAPRRRAKDFQLNPNFTFDSFIVGSSNEFAHAACSAVAQAPAKAYNPLFMYGGVGLGKTHLMQAIGNHAIKNGKYKVAYLSSEAFTNEYIDALMQKGLHNFRKKYRNADLLLIDDIQFLGGKDQFQEEFFHTFNALFDGHKQIVLACDRPANQIPGLEKRLVSRFEWGLATELEVPSVETRIAILKQKAEKNGYKVSDEIIHFLAQRISSNVRRLEGALIRAASYSSLTRKEMNMEKLEELLHDALDAKQEEMLSIEKIQRSVAEYYDLRFSDMMSKKRPANIAFPRQIAMYLSRELTDYSLPAIGDAFAKNHATVLHAWRHINKKRQEDPAVNQTLTLLKHRLSQR